MENLKCPSCGVPLEINESESLVLAQPAPAQETPVEPVAPEAEAAPATEELPPANV